jgi:rhodanese-related sulfurtransferase
MNVREAARLLERGEALALDVREPIEWNAGRVPGALHLPMSQLDQHVAELPRDTTIVVVCRSGNRSARVTRALVEADYRAENLEGGMVAWVRAGCPLDPPGGKIA